MPLQHRGAGIGVLVAFDRGPEQAPFTEDDEGLLRTFAASAADAIALNRSVTADRLASAIAAAEAERGRWARELHDQTLQSLGALRVGLASIRAGLSEEGIRAALTETIGDVETEIANLRAIIADLRPAILDDLGLTEALGALLDRHRSSGLKITHAITLEDDDPRLRLAPTLQITIYRLVQEAMTNVVKHAGATAVSITVGVSDRGGAVTVTVNDDGQGFDTGGATEGFGLAGLRERAFLAGGRLEVRSTSAGTQISAWLPLRGGRRDDCLARAVAHSGVDEMTGQRVPHELGTRLELDGETRAAPESLSVTTTLAHGHPAEQIVAQAKQGYDLIVMGSRGRSELRSLVLGSVNHQVINSSATAVLVVHST